MIPTRVRLTVLAAAAVVLAACGSSSNSGSNTTAAAGAAATTAAASGATTTADSSGGAYGYPAPATTTATTAMATAGGSSVELATVGTFGEVLVDAKGMSLYLFTKDAGGKSVCSGQCATNWPPAAAVGVPVAGTGLDAAKLSMITRDDGTKQLSYNGHPLYLYAADAAPGQASGQGVGGVWFLVNAAGEQVAAA
jgi:predicted lipoprotein with Yx(FWY)xxD motif